MRVDAAKIFLGKFNIAHSHFLVSLIKFVYKFDNI